MNTGVKLLLFNKMNSLSTHLTYQITYKFVYELMTKDAQSMMFFFLSVRSIESSFSNVEWKEENAYQSHFRMPFYLLKWFEWNIVFIRQNQSKMYEMKWNVRKKDINNNSIVVSYE